MKKIILVPAFLIILISFSRRVEAQSLTLKLSLDGKSAIVYTTAFNLDLKITPTDTLKFKDAEQPLETETAVFVNSRSTISNINRNRRRAYRCIGRSFCETK